MTPNPAEFIVTVAIYFGIPIAIARYGMKAGWSEVGVAYVVLTLFCLLWGGVSEYTWEKRLMWAAILAMIGAIPGIPLIIWLLRFFGSR